MVSSLMGILTSPFAPVIGMICFVTCAALLVFKRKTLTKKGASVLLVLLTLSVLYYLFALWLAIEFGSNPGPVPTPH